MFDENQFALRSLYKLFNIIRGMASRYFSSYIFVCVYVYFLLFSGFVPLWLMWPDFIAYAMFVLSSPLLCARAMFYLINQVCLLSRIQFAA